MTRDEAIKLIEATKKYPELHGAVFFNVGLVGHEVGPRSIYSGSYLECDIWLGERCQKASQLDQPYVAYLDGRLYRQGTSSKLGSLEDYLK